MPFSLKTRVPVCNVSICANSGRGHAAVSTHVTLSLTPERMKLLQQLVGSTPWTKQAPDTKVTWEEVEAIVAKHVGTAE
jgi:hypothetical protein